MIEFSERDTNLILQALRISLDNNTQNTDTCADLKRIINRIEENNIDRHIRNIWRSMLARCRNKKHTTYARYGGKNITVCSEWAHLKNFKKWCMENGYQIGLTIDRINGDGNYSPENCRLATQKEQQRNRNNNHMLVDPFDGENLCMAAMAEKYNMSISCLSSRINTRNMSLEDALTIPVRKVSKFINSENKKISICEKIIIWHDTVLKDGEEYTTKRIADETEVNPRSLSSAISAQHNKVIADFFKSEFQYKKYKEGNLYIKNKNWNENRESTYE